MPTVQTLSRRTIEALCEFDPVHATLEGRREHDHRLPDYAPERVDQHVRLVRVLRTELAMLERRLADPDERTDAAMLSAVLENELFFWDRPTGDWWRRDPTFYATEATDAIHHLLARTEIAAGHRAEVITARLHGIPAFLEQALRNVAKPSGIYAEIAAEMLEQAPTAARVGFAALSREAPRQAAPLRRAAAEAEGAFHAAARAWRRAGVRGKLEVLGPTLYGLRLRRSLLLDEGADAILRLAEQVLAETKKELAGLPPAPNGPAHRRGPAPATIRRATVLGYFRREVSALRSWVSRRKIATVPRDLGHVRVTEVPAYLTAIVPSMYMEPPGAFEATTDSRVYVQPVAAVPSRAQRAKWARAIGGKTMRWQLAHETYPGHHLQIAMSARHPSLIRRWHIDDVASEGWALYCEQMALEEGLFADPRAKRTMLEALRFRACRAIVDVGLQTRRMDVREAVRFLVDRAGLTRDYATREVKRYLTEPLDALTYLVGRTQFLKLRDECRQAWGPDFTLRRFHDAVLAEGVVPVRLLRGKILQRRAPNFRDALVAGMTGPD